MLGVPILVVLASRLDGEDRRRLLAIAFAALSMRIALATFFEVFPWSRITHEDARGYEAIAIAMARYWHGAGPPIAVSWKGTQNYGYYYVGGALCYLFGEYRLHLALWNALFGAINVIILYRLTSNLFHRAVGFQAARLFAFMPSMVLWNSVAIKDPVMILLVSTALYLYVLLRRKWSWSLALLLTGVITATFFIRFYISYFLILAVVGTVVVGRAREGIATWRNIAFLVFFAGIVTLSGVSSNLNEGLANATLEHAAHYRIGMANTANSGFARDLDMSSPSGLALGLPIGLGVLFFGPAPWQMTSTLPLMMLPEMIFWWSLVPSLWRGVRFAAGRAFVRSAPLLVFCISLSITYAITLGNVGAAVRQRAQIFVFLFIFVALGKYVRYCKKHRIETSLLLKNS